MKTGTILISIGIVSAVSYLLWKQFSNKKSLVGVAPVEYRFKNLSTVSPSITIQSNNILPTFGVPIKIKKRK